MSTQRKLTRAERKQIEAAIARAKNQDKKKKSAQDSIPFERMWPDGICRVKPGYFTKTVQFQDINYQLNQNEDKTAIFEGCSYTGRTEEEPLPHRNQSRSAGALSG